MRIEVKVKPGKKEAKVIKHDFAQYEVWVKSRPVKGTANKEALSLLSTYFGVKNYHIRLVSGLISPIKIFEIKE